MLVVPLHQVLCVFDGQHPTLSGEITLSQAGRGRVGWDGMGWIDGVVLLLLFVVALDSNKKIHWYIADMAGVGRYVPKRSIQVQAHRYVSIRGTLYRIRYVPAAGVAVTESENVPVARP